MSMRGWFMSEEKEEWERLHKKKIKEKIGNPVSELSSLEKTLLCNIIGEEQGRLTAKLERIRKKIDAGQKTYTEDIGAGAEDINIVRDRVMRVKEALHKTSKKIFC